MYRDKDREESTEWESEKQTTRKSQRYRLRLRYRQKGREGDTERERENEKEERVVPWSMKWGRMKRGGGGKWTGLTDFELNTRWADWLGWCWYNGANDWCLSTLMVTHIHTHTFQTITHTHIADIDGNERELKTEPQ